MGKYFYPKKIKSTLKGENTKVQVGYSKGSESHKEGDIWTDSNGKQWEYKNGYIQSIPKLQEARIPLFCPKCSNIMGKSSKDSEVYYKFGFCLNCLLERDIKMIQDGSFIGYEKKYIKDKQIGFYRESKEEIKNYLAELDEKDFIEFVNSDGKMEKWTSGPLKEFLVKELKFIEDKLLELES